MSRTQATTQGHGTRYRPGSCLFQPCGEGEGANEASAMLFRVGILIYVLCSRQGASPRAQQSVAQAEMVKFRDSFCLRSLGALDFEWTHQMNGKLQRNFTE